MSHRCGICKELALVCSSPEHGIIFTPRCGCWGCKDCGAGLREKWLAFALSIFVRSGLWEVVVCLPNEFESLAKRIRKSGGIYFRIRFGDISYVFFTPLVKTRKYTPDSSKWVNSSQVAEMFKEILYKHGVSRVSCSSGLMPVTPVVKSRWKREAIKRKSIGEFNHLLSRLCVDEKIQPSTKFNRKLVDVILLRDFPDMRKSNDPCISNACSVPEGSNRNTRSIRHAIDHSEPSWDDALAGTLVI